MMHDCLLVIYLNRIIEDLEDLEIGLSSELPFSSKKVMVKKPEYAFRHESIETHPHFYHEIDIEEPHFSMVQLENIIEQIKKERDLLLRWDKQ